MDGIFSNSRDQIKSPELQISALLKKKNLSVADFAFAASNSILHKAQYVRHKKDLVVALNESIDEQNLFDDLEGLDDSAIDTAVTVKIRSYLAPICQVYENGKFAEKSRALNLMSLIYNSAAFYNNWSTRDEISKTAVTFFDKEKTPEGNYYLTQQLDALLHTSETSTDVMRVSPTQFAIITAEGEFRISPSSEFERVQALHQRILDMDARRRKLDDAIRESYTTHIPGLGDAVTIDHGSSDPLVQERKELVLGRSRVWNDLEKLFSKPLNESAFTIHQSDRDLRDDYFDWEFFLNQNMRRDFHERAGFELEAVSAPEQYQFFQYTKEVTNKKMDEVFDFCKRFAQDGFRTFLSVEHGGVEAGDAILALGKKISQDSLKVLFKKYAEIITQVDEVAAYLKDTVGVADDAVVGMIQEHLMVKGKDLLVEYSAKAATCTETGCTELERELKDKISDIQASLFLFAGATRTLAEKGEFDFEDFKNVQIEYSREKPSESEGARMRAMALENTKQYPDKLREYWYGTLGKALENPAQGEVFISVKHKGDIVAFMRVLPSGTAAVYGASFNIDPNLKGSRIGTELLREVIENYSQTASFEADCYENNPMLDVYINKFGFQIKSTTENYHDTGTVVHRIVKQRMGQ